ncbi:MAG: hypothetical protein RLZZ399_3005, partial [Verrucomicrobiota bacterium]
MNIQRNQWLVSRRHLLRGLGAVVALPWLQCMCPSSARAATRPAAPKRSVFLYIPNGVNTLTWQIQQAGADYQFPEPLQSLERHRARVTPISGLHHPKAIGSVHSCEHVWLTGDRCGNGEKPFRSSLSADQVIAEVQGADTRFSSLELAVTGTALGWNRDGTNLPAERNPQVIFDRLFGVEKDSKEVIRKRLERRGSILDVVSDDAKAMTRKVGAEDRTKLDEYLTSLRELELRTERAKSWIETPKPKLDPTVAAHLQRKVEMSQAGEYYRLFYDLMAFALQTDSTRVISCMIGSEGAGLSIPEIGLVWGRHELSHHNGETERLRRLTEADTFLIEQFAYFLDRLNGMQELEGSLLDQTQILWGSGMSYGHGHGNANLPLLLAGGKALGFKHGKHVDFNLPTIGQYNLTEPLEHYRICTRPVDDAARL